MYEFNLGMIMSRLYYRMNEVFNGEHGLRGTEISNEIAFYTNDYLHDFYCHITERCPNIDVENESDLGMLNIELHAVLDSIHYLYSPCCPVFGRNLYPTYKEMIESFIDFMDCDLHPDKKPIIELLLKIVNEAEKLQHAEKNVYVLSRLIDVI